MPKRKLLRRQAEEIFNLYYLEGRDEYFLARRFDVSPETVRDIINRRTWKNLELKTPAEIRAENLVTARGYQAMLDDGNSVFEVAMRNNITPHELLEFIRKYGE